MVSNIDHGTHHALRHDCSMPLAHRQPVEEERPRYTFAELVEIRRQVLRYARSIQPGPDRNQHLQVAVSLRRLFRNETWRDDHIVDGPQ
jgi:hypothetical protein